MRKLFVITSLAILSLLLVGCGGSKPNAKIVSVEYVESINTSGGVSYAYEGQDIIKIVLDFQFNESIVSGLDVASDNYREELFAILAAGAHLYYAGEEIERIYGYWPNEAGNDYAKRMTLFYLVPVDHSIEDLRFVYDGAVLGAGASGIDTNIDPRG